MESISVLIIGVILFLLGIVLKLIVGRRRFYRRTFLNTEIFKSYNESLYVPLLEKMVVLLSWLFILGGMFLIGLWLLEKYAF